MPRARQGTHRAGFTPSVNRGGEGGDRGRDPRPGNLEPCSGAEGGSFVKAAGRHPVFPGQPRLEIHIAPLLKYTQLHRFADTSLSRALSSLQEDQAVGCVKRRQALSPPSGVWGLSRGVAAATAGSRLNRVSTSQAPRRNAPRDPVGGSGHSRRPPGHLPSFLGGHAGCAGSEGTLGDRLTSEAPEAAAVGGGEEAGCSHAT